MNKTLLSLTVLSSLLSAKAFATAYQCGVKYAPAEYTVEVNTSTGKAAYFDNDTWYEMKFTGANSPAGESFQRVNTYESKSLRVVFNETQKTGSIAFKTSASTKSAKSLKNCQIVADSALMSGI